MEKINYSPKYFRDNMPEWKRKKDPISCRYFYRPLSFFTASLCAKLGISANTVSYVSGWVAVLGCICFLPPLRWCHILGAVLFNVWLLMDCTDGNIARSYKRQPFGDFADALSSYMLVGLMSIFMGFAVFFDGGVLFERGNPWIILIGAIGSVSDTMMRLMYQKYLANERAMVDKGIMPKENDVRTDHSQVSSLRVRLEMELGIAGFLPLSILLGAIYNFLDIVCLYTFFYYGCSFFAAYVLYVRKAIKKAKQYEHKMTEI